MLHEWSYATKCRYAPVIPGFVGDCIFGVSLTGCRVLKKHGSGGSGLKG